MKSKLKNKELEFFKEFHELLRKYRASIVVALDDSATVLIAGRKLKNLEAYDLAPTAIIPRRLIAKTVISAIASVKLRSLAGDLKKGTSSFAPSFSSKNPTEPMPGKMPSQLDSRMKIKMVATKGRYFSAFSREPKTPSIRPRKLSTKTSKIFCGVAGKTAIFLKIKNPRAVKMTVTIQPITRVLVTGRPKTSNNFSAAISMRGIRAILYKN